MTPDLGEQPLVFVYGTLKRGFPNHHRLPTRTAYRDTAVTLQPRLLYVTLPWFSPVLLDDEGRGERVEGEVFELEKGDLADVDRLEGVGQVGGYRRTLIDVSLSGGDELAMWTYVKHPADVETVGPPLTRYGLDARYVPAEHRGETDGGR